MKEKNITVLYHANCRDGFSGAFAAWKKFGDAADYVPLYHTDPVPVEKIEGREVYCVDFSYNEGPSLDLLLEKARRVVLIDHHITAQKVLGRYHETLFALDRSGATLAWEYFHPGQKLPKLFTYIEALDLGRFDEPGVKETKPLIILEDRDFKGWEDLIADYEDDDRREALMRDGRLLDRYANAHIEKIITNAEEVTFEGHRCLIVNSSIFVSAIGKALYEKMPPLGLIWSWRKGRIIVSLRSNGEVDVAALAEKYGGGGHRQSAACYPTLEEFLKLLTGEKNLSK